ncbi:MAG: HAD family phosphatase [Bacteroidales bacterium]|nr:HAD family phosphatase [Bacteroidales bacterium]
MKTTHSDIKNIIFDLGGVMIDIDTQAIGNQMNKMGFTNVEKLHDPEFLAILERFEKGIIKASTFRNEVKNFLKISVTDAVFDEIWNSMLFDIPQRRIDLVKQLKQNYHVFLLSNSNEIHYDLYVRDLQLRYGYREFDSLFDKAFFSFALHLSKPDLDIFRYVLDSESLKPEETLFIDDLEENRAAARKLGIHTIDVATGSRIVDLFENGLLKANTKID